MSKLVFRVTRFALIPAMCFFAGCATKLTTTVDMPAKNGNVINYKTVAVFPFDTSRRGSSDYSGDLEAVIVSAKAGEKTFFTVVERSKIDTVMKELNFQMSVADPDSMVEMGKQLGVEAMWFGHSDRKYDESSYEEGRRKCDKDGKNCQDYKVRCVQKTLTLNVNPRLVSTSTGKVVYSNLLTDTISVGRCQDEDPVSENQLEALAKQNILTAFRKDIAPYAEDVKLELMSSKDGITDDTSKDKLKEGIRLAKDKRLDRACETWNTILEKNPEAVAPAYNYALCLELAGEYQKAIDILEKIEKVLPPSGFFGNTLSMFSIKSTQSELVIGAIERNKANIENREKLKKQMSTVQ